MSEVMDDWGLPTPAGLARQGEARRQLAEVVEAVRAAPDRAGRLGAWSAACGASDAIAEAAAADEAAVEALLVRAEAAPGMAEPVGRLRRRITDRLRGWRRHMDALGRAGRAPEGLGEAPRPPDLPAACQVPAPYHADAGGVWRTIATEEGERVVPVCSSPVYITGRAVDAETGARWLDLAWPSGVGGWTRETVSRAEVADTRAVVRLAGRGAPVHSGTAREVVPFLAALEADWQHELPLEPVAGRCGWHGDGALVGPRWIGPGSLRLRAGELEQLLGEARPAGTWEGWCSTWAAASEYPLPCLAVYASVASMLLAPMGLPGAVLDLWGRTTGGKTVTLRLAGSVWGSTGPAGLMRQWDATQTWIERAAEALGSLPLLLDDTRQRQAKGRDDLAQIVYHHVFGQTRGRGSVVGVQRSASWTSWLLSTGEAPLLQGGGADGARGRVLSLGGSPFGAPVSAAAIEQGRAVAGRIAVGVSEDYGHLGPRAVEWAVAHRADLAALARERVEAWARSSRDTGPIGQRLSAAVAGLDAAAIVCHDHLGLPPPSCDPWSAAIEGIARAGVEADQPLAAWRAVHARAVAAGLAWWGRGPKDRDPPGGWLGAWEVLSSTGDEPPPCILPHVLREWLEEERQDYEATLSEWARREWIEVDGEGHRSKPRKVGISRPRLVCFTDTAMEVL